MAEPTLALQLNDLESEIGLFLGYGRGALLGDPAWSSQQQAVISSLRRSGERQFLYPPALPEFGLLAGYDWSFLKPTANLALPARSRYLQLPDDFGGIEGEIALAAGESTAWWPLQVTGPGSLYNRYAESPTTTGRPLMACVEPIKGTGPTQGQRFQLQIWPLADQAYGLQFAYYLNPDALAAGFPYAYGGAQHAETLLESCLAMAEQRLDDQSGVHTAKFKERLLASMNIDRRSKPQTLGYNRDHSDLRDRRGGLRGDQHGESLVSYRGVQY